MEPLEYENRYQPATEYLSGCPECGDIGGHMFGTMNRRCENSSCPVKFFGPRIPKEPDKKD